MAQLGTTAAQSGQDKGRADEAAHAISGVQCDRWMGRQLDLQSPWLRLQPLRRWITSQATAHLPGFGGFLYIYFWQLVGFFFPLLFVCLFLFFKKALKKKKLAAIKKKNPFPLEAGRGFIDR